MNHCFRPAALTAAAVAFAAVLTAGAGAAPVTGGRLLNAASEPQNWLMGSGDYAATRYSGLDGLKPGNLDTARLLFSVSLGPISAGEGFEHTRISAPLVDDGMLYVADALGTVYKIDVRSGVKGRILWTSPPIDNLMDSWLSGQWSITLAGNSVVLAAADGRLFWIDRDSGALERSAQVGDPATGYQLKAPPLLVDNTLIVGGAGGDRGARPRIDGIDAQSGAPIWNNVLSGADGPFVAGGSFSRTGVYDARSGLTMWSTDGPQPAFDPRRRTGIDTANSVLAFDAKTGREAWRRGLFDNDVLGFDGSITPILLGDSLAHAGDDGVFRRIAVADGALEQQTPFVAGREWAGAVDAKSGVITPAAVTVGDGCPNVISEPTMPASLSGRTGLLYAAANNGCRADLSAIGNLEGRPLGGRYSHKTTATGALAAIDPASGKVVAEHVFDYPLQSGLLSTAGGLVFAETADGFVHLLDDRTLEPLWSLKISSMLASPPISYAVDGRQYIAFLIGGTPLYSELAYHTTGMSGVRHLTVLAVIGLSQ